MTGQGGWGGPPQGGGWQGGPHGGPHQQHGQQPQHDQQQQQHWQQQQQQHWQQQQQHGQRMGPPGAKKKSSPIGWIVALVVMGGIGAGLFYLAQVRAANQEQSKRYRQTLENDKQAKLEADEEAEEARSKERKDLEAKVRARMKIIDKIAAGALPAPSSRPVVKLSGPKPVFYPTEADANSNAIEEPAQHWPIAISGVGSDYHSSNDLHECAAFVKGKKTDISTPTLEACVKPRYLAIIRTKIIAEPKVLSDNRYLPGNCTGDAIVFDLANGEQVAAVPTTGTNSDKITKYGTGSGLSDLRRNLERGCTWAAQLQINEAYAKK